MTDSTAPCRNDATARYAKRRAGPGFRRIAAEYEGKSARKMLADAKQSLHNESIALLKMAVWERNELFAQGEDDAAYASWDAIPDDVAMYIYHNYVIPIINGANPAAFLAEIAT